MPQRETERKRERGSRPQREEKSNRAHHRESECERGEASKDSMTRSVEGSN